jgi:AcrR family transcriptional regulator
VNGALRKSRVDRRKLELALIDEVVEEGFAGASVEGVCQRAETDLEGFQNHFADLEDAAYEVFKALREDLLQRLLPAFAGQATWRDQIRAVAYAMFDYIDEDRRRGNFMFVQIMVGGERAQRLRDQGTAAMAQMIDQGRNQLDNPEQLSRGTAEAIAGSIFQQIRGAVERDDANARDLVPQLMYNVVLPYLGSEAAGEELTLPPPSPAAERPAK